MAAIGGARAKDHYVPAALIGRFSEAPAKPLRRSPIWVGRTGSDKPFSQVAENVAWVRDFYASYDPASGERWSAVDEAWKIVERRLPEALSVVETTSSVLSARLFAEVLVPFVTQVFVRGVDFERRFLSRMKRVVGNPSEADRDLEFEKAIFSRENMNSARLIEMQRLFSPILRARWWVLHTDEAAPFITSDVGYAPFYRRRRFRAAIGDCVIPISRKCAIQLQVRRRTPRVAVCIDDRWLVDVDPVVLRPGAVEEVNRQLARFAVAELYGGSEDAVAELMPDVATAEFVPELIWDEAKMLRRNERELFSFLLAVAGTGEARPTGDDPVDPVNLPTSALFEPVGDKGLPEEEEVELENVERREAEREHKALSRRLGIEMPLEPFRMPPESAS